MGAKQERDKQALRLWRRGAKLYPLVAERATVDFPYMQPKMLRWLERQLKAEPERAWFKLLGWFHGWQVLLREARAHGVERELLRRAEEKEANELKQRC